MKRIPLDQVVVGKRHRKELGDVQALADSMASVGLLHPIVLRSERELIAGQRRLAAARLLGWSDIPFVQVDLDAIVRGEWAENTERKEFTAGEAYAICKVLLPLEQAAAKDRQEAGRKSGGRGKKKLGSKKEPSMSKKSKHRAAKATGFSAATLSKIGEIKDAAESNPVFSDFAEKIEHAERGQVNGIYLGFKRAAKASAVRSMASLPGSKYVVLYADPPWSYDDKCDDGSVQGGGAEQHYESMSIRALCDMTVPAGWKETRICDLAEREAVLFLWTTSPLLLQNPGPRDVIQAWGFTYKASFVWDKVKHNMGRYNSVRHELLICTRGSFQATDPHKHDSVQVIDRGRHSEKPDAFRAIIDALYPDGKRIELFARKAVKGWDRWGHEA